MASISFFGGIDGAGDEMGEIQGSSFGKPDGTTHQIELLTDHAVILRVKLEGSKDSVDLLFSKDQARAFGESFDAALRRLGLDDIPRPVRVHPRKR